MEVDAKKLATGLAATRLAIGAGLAGAPRTATRGWIGPHSENEGARLMARAVGGRDIGLAAGILASLPGRRRWGRSGAAQRWVEAAAFADAIDFLATVAARRSLPPTALAVGTSMAGASAAAHLWLSRQLG